MITPPVKGNSRIKVRVPPAQKTVIKVILPTQKPTNTGSF